MAISLKKPEEIEILKSAGKRLAIVINEVGKAAVAGVSTNELNDLAESLIRKEGDIPAFLHYKPQGAPRPFPASACISINNVVVHGIPNENPQILKEGDIVSLDMGLVRKGLVVDATITVGVGHIDERAASLIAVTKRALERAIAAALPNNYVSDISNAIEESVIGTGFSLAEEYGGHGVGYKVHEDPHVPNVTGFGKGARLVPNMVLAIEPIVIEGKNRFVVDRDGYTVRTKDGSRSAQFEHTIVITNGKPVVVTA
jgi:methionyl aminopeptidase